MNHTQGVFSQIQATLNQMQQLEQQNANQLRQLARQLDQLAQHESSASHYLHQLNHLCQQLAQGNQHVNPQYSVQPMYGQVHSTNAYGVTNQQGTGNHIPHTLTYN